MNIDPEAAGYRLATYGTLAPGRINAHQLDALTGDWTDGTVRGHLVERGWGAAMGYPALYPDQSGPEIAVQLFQSADLPDHWARLDAFEGEEYVRVAVPVLTADGPVKAFIYADSRSKACAE